jgi:hypothetical protein
MSARILPPFALLLAACLPAAPLPAPTIELGPATPTTSRDLEVMLLDAPEDGPARFEIAWLRDGEEVGDLADETVVPSDRTEPWQVWTVRVVMEYEGAYGEPAEASIEVLPTGLFGAMTQAFDFAQDAEDMGYVDCSATMSLTDTGALHDVSCPTCQVEFVTQMSVEQTDCDTDWFQGGWNGELDWWPIGFRAAEMYYWDVDLEDWFFLMPGEMTGDRESGTFVGDTDWLDQPGGTQTRVQTDVAWND